MNVDENGSVANTFVQNIAFFLNGNVDVTIREAGQSLKKHHSDKSHSMTSIGIGFIIFARAHDLNNWTRLCWGESMWPEH